MATSAYTPDLAPATRYQPRHKLYSTVRPFRHFKPLFPTSGQWRTASMQFILSRVILLATTVGIVAVTVDRHIAFAEQWQTTINRTVESIIEEGRSRLVTNCAYVAEVPHGDAGYRFLELPYSQEPAGQLRFARPVYAILFEECYRAFWHAWPRDKRHFSRGGLTVVADTPRPQCTQLQFGRRAEGSEHCLTLSIITPRILTERKMPTVVYIGGRRYSEHRPHLPTLQLARELQVVFVSLKYRLGLLGFADFRYKSAKGNLGVFDARMALWWTKTFIAQFGGDPDNVVVFGEDSGATTALLILNNERRLIDRLWLASGSIVVPRPRRYASSAPSFLSGLPDQCQTRRTPKAKLECARGVEVMAMMRKTTLEWRRSDNYFCFLPNKNERKITLPHSADDEEFLTNPLEVVGDMPMAHEMDDVPVVIRSTVNDIPARLERWRKYANLTRLQMTDLVKNNFRSYQGLSSQKQLHQDILMMSKQSVDRLEEIAQATGRLNALNETVGFEQAVYYILTDLRVACAYTLLAKYLQVNAHVANSPIYRIQDDSRIANLRAVDAEGNICDLPIFLVTKDHPCHINVPGRNTKSFPSYTRHYRNLFMHFIRGEELPAQKARYPIRGEDADFEESFTIIGNLGPKASPGIRLNTQNGLCKAWTMGDEEITMIRQSGRVN